MSLPLLSPLKVMLYETFSGNSQSQLQIIYSNTKTAS